MKGLYLEPKQGSKSGDFALAKKACGGDQSAAAALIEPLHRPLYNLARRFVWDLEDAEDLTQEAILQVITRLSEYRGEARFVTWAYRVALNKMMNTRRRRMEVLTTSFDHFGDDLDRAMTSYAGQDQVGLDHALLIEEVKIGCMTGMLLCLGRPARMAYILGEIFEIDSTVAASLCEISPTAFRQRLSRARKTLNGFMQSKCGVISVTAPCSCEKVVDCAVASKLVDPSRLHFASKLKLKVKGDRFRLTAAVNKLEVAIRTVEHFRNHPDYQPEQGFESWLKGLMSSKALSDIVNGQLPEVAD